MDLFKRQTTSSVIGYTVTLLKDDYKNRKFGSEQRRQLRVYMEGNTVKHFEISQKLGNLQFEIAQIISYEETPNRVLLKIVRSKAYEDVRKGRCDKIGGVLQNFFTLK